MVGARGLEHPSPTPLIVVSASMAEVLREIA
jgi:hypothetical protein